MAAAQHRDRCRRGAEDGEAELGDERAQALGQRRRRLLDALGVGVVEHDAHEPAVRRVAELAAQRVLLRREALVVVLRRVQDRGVRRRLRLHDDLALDVAAAGPAGDLHEQLEGALVRRGSRGSRASCRPSITPTTVTRGKSQALGDHLRADQHVDVAAAEVSSTASYVLAPLHRVLSPCAGCAPGESGSPARAPHPLGAGAPWIEDLRGARVAPRRTPPAEPAVVATQPVLPQVVGEADVAVRALGHLATGLALQIAGEAAAVVEDDRLFPALEGVLERLDQGGPDGLDPPVGLAPTIDELHRGQAAAGAPRGLGDAADGACPRAHCDRSRGWASRSRAPPAPTLPPRAAGRRRARGSAGAPPPCTRARAPRRPPPRPGAHGREHGAARAHHEASPRRAAPRPRTAPGPRAAE